jgi:hypothetical protein
VRAKLASSKMACGNAKSAATKQRCARVLRVRVRAYGDCMVCGYVRKSLCTPSRESERVSESDRGREGESERGSGREREPLKAPPQN